MSLDGIPVIHHDELLDRTTDGTGPVYEKTLAELKLLDAGSYFSAEFAGEQIPTLAEALDTTHLHVRLVLDIKKYQYIPAIAAVIQSHAFPEEKIIGWIRYGTGMADYYKQFLPNSQVLLGTNGPGWFEEYEIGSGLPPFLFRILPSPPVFPPSRMTIAGRIWCDPTVYWS